jgi:hypothetical protein
MALVEFCGLPGCGKSTINRLLVDRLRSAGVRIVDRPIADREIKTRYVGAAAAGTAVEALRYSIAKPDWARAILPILCRSQSRETVRCMIRVQHQLRISLTLGRTQRFVLDEWLIHVAWLALAYSNRVRLQDIQDLIRSVSTELEAIPRLLVRLTASPAVAASRVLSRPDKTWFQELSHERLVRMFDDGSGSLDVLCKTACVGSTRMISFDTTDTSPIRIVDELLPQIKGFL